MLKFDWNILWTFFNLIIFYLLMRKFLFGRIQKVLDKRQELIDNKFKDADAKNAEAESFKAQYEQQLSGVEAEKTEIINKAREDARAEYDKTLDRAQLDAQKIKDDAAKTARIQSENTKRAVKEEIANIALEAAEKVVGREISAQTDSSIFDEFLNESSDD